MPNTKKLYKRGGKVHPSLLVPSIDDYLASLPSATLAPITALSDEDKRILAYLVSWSNNKEDGNDFGAKNDNDNTSHAFNCDCFGCYTSFWARWDSSPNRQLIHEIIEAYEDELAKKKKVKNGKMKRSQKKKKMIESACDEQRIDPDLDFVNKKEVEELVDSSGNDICGEEGTEKGTFRRLLSFIGEKFSGMWNTGQRFKILIFSFFNAK